MRCTINIIFTCIHCIYYQYRRVIRREDEREEKLGRKLDFLHEQLAFGECGFFYLSMRDPKSGVIPEERIKQWFGEERLPNGWWEAVRPSRTVGFIETRKTAYVVEQLVKTFRFSERM